MLVGPHSWCWLMKMAVGVYCCWLMVVVDGCWWLMVVVGVCL